VRSLSVTILQPPYPEAGTIDAARETVRWCFDRLASIAPGRADLVVLPEYANVPGLDDRELIGRLADETHASFRATLAGKANRIGGVIAYGMFIADGPLARNRTWLVHPDGREWFYDKTHLTDVESKAFGITAGDEAKIFEVDGLRIAVAVCFEMYFPEYFARLAALRPDIIVVPSYQRSETGSRIELLSGCRAFDAGAFLVRSSYSRDVPGVAGHSLVASADGTIVANLAEAPGILTVSIDPTRRYRKPAHHGGSEVEHRTLIDTHRRPEIYRPAADRATAVASFGYPRRCAHRGLSQRCPENTLPAFAAAIAVGAEEIELDVSLSADGVPVVCHDATVDRTTDGSGRIGSMSWHQIRALDAGIRNDEAWRGVHIPRFEEVAALAAGRTVMNIHLKEPGPGGSLVRIVWDVLRREGAVSTAYLAGDEDVLRYGVEICPTLERACLASQHDPPRQVEIARAYACSRLQFGRKVDDSSIRAAKQAGLICNLFYSDDEAEARNYVERGIDVILTNRANTMRLLPE
jgi:glycerophosphoryl diester phosphodiesterase